MSKICFVGDVHGHVQAFLHIIANSKVPVFQLGDMGLGFNGVNLPKLAQEHRFIRGNHDGPQACREHANYAGDYGYDPELGLFYLGGAYSIDYAWRKARMAQGGMYSANSGKLWWPDEELSELELDRALYLYDKYKPRVVATHECPANIAKLLLNYLGGGLYASAKADCMDSRTSKWLERMLQLHQPDFWVFGHYHADWKVKVGPTLFKCCAELSKFELDLP